MSNQLSSSIWFDKMIDLVLMFVGLYAAMEVQDFVDYRQDKKQYKQLLEGFKDELKNNQKQKLAIEGGLGATDQLADFGDAEKSLDYFMALSEYAVQFSGCYVDLRLNGAKLAGERAKTCKRLFKKRFTVEKPPHLELSPVYRRDVWRLYLADGVQLFREFESKQKKARCAIGEGSSKKLTICVGSIYAELDEIELRVGEIQRLVNETYFYYQGVLEASFNRFKKRVQTYKGRKDKVAVEVITEARDALHNEIEKGQQAVEISRSQMRSKIRQLKREVLRLDGRFTEVRGAIKSELR